jgi:hypothetical protein
MIVFISETRFFSDRVDGILRSLGFDKGLGVGNYGRGGGIALLWKELIGVKLQSLDKLHIDVVILDPVTNNEKWRLTGFLGKLGGAAIQKLGLHENATISIFIVVPLYR